jgi:hypothetical protein
MCRGKSIARHVLRANCVLWFTSLPSVKCVSAVPATKGGNPMAKGWFSQKEGQAALLLVQRER